MFIDPINSSKQNIPLIDFPKQKRRKYRLNHTKILYIHINILLSDTNDFYIVNCAYYS